MADNVTADPGVGGATFAADDIGGVHFPRTKITVGADGSNDGDVSSANPMPVTANAGTNLNTSLLALEAGGNLAGAATSLAVIDDWDETDRAKVNLIVGQAGVAGGTGTVGATTVRVTHATDVTVATKETRSATGTTSQVADTNVSTTLLASNASRLGASIQNDSSAVLYLKCGTTASATDYTARLVQYSYWEAPFGYTGRIDGIWATDPGDGAARVTEFT